MHQEGYVNVEGGRIWYEVSGSGNASPLLVLHGGPGSSHLTMSPLRALQDERPVILYDQLGCGKSDRPADDSLWVIDRFVRELDELRKALGIEHVHILGHSWGTMLLTDYLLTKPHGVESAIFSGPCLSAARWVEDANRYRRNLPEDVQEVLRECEAAGDTDSDAYRDAAQVYMKKHVCRIELPQELREKQKQFVGKDVYNTMWGPSEFHATGNLKDYDRTDVLHEIRIPCLFTCGRHDEASPESTRYYQSLVLGSELHVYSDSAHLPQLEQTDEYIRVVRDFLHRVEQPS